MTTTPTTWRTLSILGVTLRFDKRVLSVCLALFALLIALMFVSLSYGEFSLSLADVVNTLFGGGDNMQTMVVWDLRLPRILVALLIGVAMSVAGAMLQGITRNPLADPGIIGINQGAAVVAVAVFVWFEAVSIYWLPFFAFAGGSVTAMLIYLLAWKGGSSPVRLVLVGIGVAAFAQALAAMMIVLSDINRVSQAYLWLSGSVYGRGWDSVLSLLLWLIVLLTLAYFLALPMNALQQDDQTVVAIGVSIEKYRFFTGDSQCCTGISKCISCWYI